VGHSPCVSPATPAISASIPTLTDGVVTLRGLLAGDLEALVEHGRDPQMARWTAVPQPYTRADAEAFLAIAADGWSSGTLYEFAVEVDGRLAGVIDLRPQGAGLGEVGFSLTAWARGRGLITRALRLAIPWGFSQARIEVLHWRAQLDNWPSRRVAWAVGFRVGSAVPGLLEHRGQRVDGWIAALRPGDRLEPAHAWLDPGQILGQGVNLREHREQDIPRIIEGCTDEHTRHWLSKVPDNYTSETAREYLHGIRCDQASGGGVHWAVADPADDRMLGEMAIFIRDPADRQGEVGYWTHPDARGQGKTTEAVRLAVRHALLPAEDGGLGLARVLLRAAVGNIGSQRVAVKAGFTRTGIDRQGGRLRDGSMVDDLRFDLLADELPAVR
jgi:RimJ/RimL family protein N-acetyltransferase